MNNILNTYICIKAISYIDNNKILNYELGNIISKEGYKNIPKEYNHLFIYIDYNLLVKL